MSISASMVHIGISLACQTGWHSYGNLYHRSWRIIDYGKTPSISSHCVGDVIQFGSNFLLSYQKSNNRSETYCQNN
jgi:hypothetical protein